MAGEEEERQKATFHLSFILDNFSNFERLFFSLIIENSFPLLEETSSRHPDLLVSLLTRLMYKCPVMTSQRDLESTFAHSQQQWMSGWTDDSDMDHS